MLDMLDDIEENSIDSIVTDPPYELNFMGKGWDNAGVSFQSDTWKKCYDVLKPGGYLLAFGGSRTFHRIACAIEDAGFEIRDTIMWLYGSGFPKSMALDKALEAKLTTGSGNKTGFRKLKGELVDRGDYGYAKMQNEQGNRPTDYNKIEDQRLGKLEATTDLAKKYKGWGTCLKPSFEPIIVARKPFKGSLVDNVIEYGVGGLNIDECRVGNEVIKGGTMPKMGAGDLGVCNYATIGAERIERQDNIGRFPANTILTYDETDFDEVCGGFPYTKNSKRSSKNNKDTEYTNTYTPPKAIYTEDNTYGDSGSASRYFYCAKASKKDRDEGLEEFEDKLYAQSNGSQIAIAKGEEYHKDGIGLNQTKLRKNTHPTVKPCDLMQSLIRLVTPNGGTILDPFNGSGGTGKAVMYENKERDKNYKYIGIELTEEYLPISKARIEYICGDLECNDESLDLSDLD
jgi:site-specific DNA-methyltransferase (adenine-specific)